MSATMKHIPTKSSANLDDYLEREKEGNDLPRVLYEAGRHCRPATAKSEFRSLREEHGRQGEMRTVPATYKEPEDPAEATHIKIGKNWREAKEGETATHRRIEPAVPLEKRPEAFHFIYSFDLATVNPDDPEATRKAFDAVVAFREQDTPGTQSKFVAHGDAHGSRVAIERGEGGKFHVHEMMNAVVHSDMEVDGRAFEPGMRVGGPITHVDTMRTRWDEFLNTRGHEFGLTAQDRSVLPEVGSPEYRAVRRSEQDFWDRERGRISDHDRARRGLETTFERLSQDPDALAGLDRDERLRRLADDVGSTGDVELKLRETKTGEVKVRSFVVPGRQAPIGSTKLGGRYDNAGLAEQLELIGEGRWTPYERPQVGDPKEIAELSDAEVAKLQGVADRLALDEQREVELDRWLEARAAGQGTSVEALWAEQGMTGTPGEREVAHGWKTSWEKEQAVVAEESKRDLEPFRGQYPEEMALLTDMYAEDYLSKNPSATAAEAALIAEGTLKGRAYVGELGPDLRIVRSELAAQRTAEQASRDQQQTPAASPQDAEHTVAGQPKATSPAETGTTDPEPRTKRRERQVGVLTGDQKKDVEINAVVRAERADGGAYVDFQIDASDPAAQGQSGLHLSVRDQKRADGRTVTKTWKPLTADQYSRLQDAAGDNRTEVDGKPVLAIRGDVATSTRNGDYALDARSMRPSQRDRIGSDVIDRQRASEDRARAAQKEKSASREQIFDKSKELRTPDRTGGMSL